MRGTGVVLTIAGGSISIAGGYDLFANTIPKVDRFEDETDRRYPLVDAGELQTSSVKIADFEEQVKNLIKSDNASQIPQLVEETGIREDYNITDQQEVNEETRRTLSLEDPNNGRLGLGILSLAGGLIPALTGIQLVLRRERNMPDAESKVKNIA